MDQATKAFHEKDEYYRDPKLNDRFYAEYTRHIERLHQQLKIVLYICYGKLYSQTADIIQFH